MSAPQIGDVITTVEELDALPYLAFVASPRVKGLTAQRVSDDRGVRQWLVPYLAPMGAERLAQSGPWVVAYLPGHLPRPERVVKAEALREAASLLYTDDGPRNPLSTATWLHQRAEDLEAAVTP